MKINSLIHSLGMNTVECNKRRTNNNNKKYLWASEQPKHDLIEHKCGIEKLDKKKNRR